MTCYELNEVKISYRKESILIARETVEKYKQYFDKGLHIEATGPIKSDNTKSA